MRATLILILTLLLCLSPGVQAQMAGESCALIVDAKGKVEFKQAGQSNWAPGSLMTLLHRDAQVKVAAGGQAMVASTKTSERTQLDGPCTVQIVDEGVKILAGTAAQVKSSKPVVKASTGLASFVNVQRMGGGRTRAQQALLITSDPASLDARPTLTWDPGSKAFSSFDLKVTEDGAEKAVVNLTLPGAARSYRFEPNALQAGKNYFISLTGFDGTVRTGATYEGLASESDIVLSILGADIVQALAQSREGAEAQFRADPQHVGELVGLLSLYWQNNLYTPALELGQRLLQARPDDPNLHLMMARIYRMKSQPDQAAKMEKKAWGH